MSDVIAFPSAEDRDEDLAIEKLSRSFPALTVPAPVMKRILKQAHQEQKALAAQLDKRLLYTVYGHREPRDEAEHEYATLLCRALAGKIERRVILIFLITRMKQLLAAEGWNRDAQLDRNLGCLLSNEG